MILNILLILLGASLLVYSLCELRVWGGLFFDRDSYCIEKFRATEKAADLVSCWHNVAKGVFGFLVILAGLRPWLPDAGIVSRVFLVSFAMLAMDMLVVEVVSRTRKLREVRVAIAQQWKAQKHISAEHNHEVNLYRDAGRLTQSYPKHIVAMGVGMLLLLVI